MTKMRRKDLGITFYLDFNHCWGPENIIQLFTCMVREITSDIYTSTTQRTVFIYQTMADEVYQETYSEIKTKKMWSRKSFTDQKIIKSTLNINSKYQNWCLRVCYNTI